MRLGFDRGPDAVDLDHDALLLGVLLREQQLDLAPAVGDLGVARGDSLRGESGDDRVRGGDGDDVLRDITGNDSLNGKSGDDTLSGGAGDDLLIGDSDTDWMKGVDDDTFVFGAENQGDDVIADFDTAGDVIDLSAFGLTWAEVQAATEDDGSTTSQCRIESVITTSAPGADSP